jgi:hypothetical protein
MPVDQNPPLTAPAVAVYAIDDECASGVPPASTVTVDQNPPLTAPAVAVYAISQDVCGEVFGCQECSCAFMGLGQRFFPNPMPLVLGGTSIQHVASSDSGLTVMLMDTNGASPPNLGGSGATPIPWDDGDCAFAGKFTSGAVSPDDGFVHVALVEECEGQPEGATPSLVLYFYFVEGGVYYRHSDTIFLVAPPEPTNFECGQGPFSCKPLHLPFCFNTVTFPPSTPFPPFPHVFWSGALVE